jgi:hypothetical protein
VHWNVWRMISLPPYSRSVSYPSYPSFFLLFPSLSPPTPHYHLPSIASLAVILHSILTARSCSSASALPSPRHDHAIAAHHLTPSCSQCSSYLHLKTFLLIPTKKPLPKLLIPTQTIKRIKTIRPTHLFHPAVNLYLRLIHHGSPPYHPPSHPHRRSTGLPYLQPFTLRVQPPSLRHI